MKFLNKAITYILCLALILNISTVAYGTELINSTDEIHSYTVNVSSNESSTSSVTFYEFEGKYYLALDDIKDFTRCTLTEDAETIMLTHGLREIVINKSTGQMVDSGMVDQGNISLLNCNGIYLCEGIPMLRYLGAMCSIRDDKIEILMPSFTIWESIMPDYLDYYFNINELYGGEDNVKISLTLDVIADVLDGVSGHGLMANADMHLEDALYEILNVDMMKYVSAQDAATTLNQKINDFLASAVFNTALDTGDNTYDAVYEALDYYVKFYVSGKNDILLNMMTQTDDLEYASDLASQIQAQVYSQSAAKANLKSAKTAQSFMDIGMLAFDTAITSYSMIQYDDDTRSLFARTINQEMFKYADYYDISWNNVSDKISNTLKSTQSIVAHTAIENVAEFAVKKVTEEGAKSAISAFTSKSNIYSAAAQIGLFVASLINYESNQAYSADMNAIWLSAVQYDIAMLASSLLVKERDEFHFSSTESLEKLKDMFTLYYRTTIAFSENIALSIEEFGSKKDKKWVEWFSSNSGVSVANYTADYLYKITNCEIVPIVDFSAISDDVITYDWISNSHSGELKPPKNNQDNKANAYNAYVEAAQKTMASGSWSEYLTMTANMAITDGSAKTKTKVTLTSDADVSNYSESDPSQIHMSGSAEMTVMGQTYAWDMEYENGTAHYRYTKPNQTSADMKIDPSFFNFGTMTSDMMTDAKLSGNKITFTVPGDKIAEVGIAAVNQMSGVDNLEYGDVDVTVTISNEGKIDNIVMVFHASLEYQGYDADVDYNIDYRFADSAEKSDKPASGDTGNLHEYLDFSKSWGIRKDVSTDPNLYMEQVCDFAFMEDGTFYCYFYQQYTDFIYGFSGTYLYEDYQIKFYFDNDDGTSTLYAYSFDPDAMKLTQVSEKGIWGTSIGTVYSLENDEWFPAAQDVINSAKRAIDNKGMELGG